VIPIHLLVSAVIAVAFVGAGRRIERLVVADRSLAWRGMLVAVGIDATPAAITGRPWAGLAVLFGVDAGWQLLAELQPRLPRRPRRNRPDRVPDNVVQFPRHRPATTTTP